MWFGGKRDLDLTGAASAGACQIKPGFVVGKSCHGLLTVISRFLGFFFLFALVFFFLLGFPGDFLLTFFEAVIRFFGHLV